MEMRRENIKRVFWEIKKKICNEKGQQTSNLTGEEEEGIKSLRKRIEEEDLIVMKTDKSGKFAVTNRENYERLGEAHTGKDRKIEDEEAREKERVINGHTSMWIKMTCLGEAHNHEDRARESKLSKSQNLASMYLLLKDHKEKLSTRPVVTGCNSNTLGLSNIVAELLESVCNSMSSPYEVISTEDMLSRIEDCNRDILRNRAEKIDRGESLTKEDEELFVIANDVVALFPSMSSERTGKVVRELVEESELKFEGMDYMEIARYIAVEKDKTGDLEEIECLLPTRKFKRGVTPGIKNPECSGKDKNTQIVWVFPDKSPTDRQKKVLVSRMAEIGVRTLFENFCYKFAGHSYIQLSGGPIGARVTMAAARLVMHHWSVQYRQILEKSGLAVKMFGGYVDDGRQATSLMKRGMRYVDEAKQFVYNAEWEAEDDLENLPDLTRMSRECNLAMNNINPDLKFTVETELDYVEMRLPSLDFYMWVEDGLIHHSYYEKPMRTQLVLMKKSSMGIQQKMDILSNELIRRLSVVGEGISIKEKVGIIDHYSKQLKNSGYDRKMIKKIIVCGLRGFMRKV